MLALGGWAFLMSEGGGSTSAQLPWLYAHCSTPSTSLKDGPPPAGATDSRRLQVGCTKSRYICIGRGAYNGLVGAI